MRWAVALVLILALTACSEETGPTLEKAKPTGDSDISCSVSPDCLERGFLHKDCRDGRWRCVEGECMWECP